MASHQGADRQQQLRQLLHDVHDSLHAIGLGVQLIKNHEQRDEQFEQICQLVEREHLKAVRLVQELDGFIRPTSSDSDH